MLRVCTVICPVAVDAPPRHSPEFLSTPAAPWPRRSARANKLLFQLGVPVDLPRRWRCGKIPRNAAPPRSSCPAARGASVAFSCRLNIGEFVGDFRRALDADFSTSISECRHGCPGSALLNRNDVWPRMLVSALLKSSDTVRASCSAQSSFCLSVSPASASVLPSAGGEAGGCRRRIRCGRWRGQGQ